MKLRNLLILISLFCAAVSCKKSGSAPVYPLNIYGKWNMLKDSTSGGAGPLYQGVYNGRAGDCYEFSPGGLCYIKAASRDTLTYTITSDTTIAMAGFLYNSVVVVTKPHDPYKYITLTSSTTDPTGGHFYRRVWLGR